MARRQREKEFKDGQIIDISEARKERERPSRRHTAKNLRRKLVYGIIIFSILMVVGGSLYNLISLKSEEAAAREKLEALEAEKKTLEEELSIVDSKEYIEQKAREQLKMILPGETLYIVKEKESSKDEATNQ
jgi:cell division protein DivIC